MVQKPVVAVSGFDLSLCEAENFSAAITLQGFGFKSQIPIFETVLELNGEKGLVKSILGSSGLRLSACPAADVDFPDAVLFEVCFVQGQNDVLMNRPARLRLGPFSLPQGTDWGLAQGWQCWSESPILSKDGVLGGDLEKERWVFGDNHFYPYEEKPGRFHAWFFSYCGLTTDRQVHGFMAADSGGVFATCFVYDLQAGKIFIDIDTQGFDWKNVSSLEPCRVRFILPKTLSRERMLSQDFEAWERHLRSDRLDASSSSAMQKPGGSLQEGHSSATSFPLPPVTGYTSWYHHYYQIDAALIEKNLLHLKNSMTIFQIDDGYQKSIGEWTETKASFGPEGSVENIVANARAKGVLPGLWLAPFVAVMQSGLVQKNPDWLLRDTEGVPIRVGHIAHWGGDFFSLDTEREDYKKWLKEVIVYWTQKGVVFFKCDFLYAPGVTAVPGLTRLQRAARAHRFLHNTIREHGAFLLSCGGILDQALDRCEYSRIGADVGQTWVEPNSELRHHLRWSREKVSTTACLTNTVTRAAISGHGFYNDSDVSVLRSYDTELSLNERRLLAHTNAALSDVQFVSCDLFNWDDNARLLDLEMKRVAQEKRVYFEKVAPIFSSAALDVTTDNDAGDDTGHETGNCVGVAKGYYLRARDKLGQVHEQTLHLG